MPPIELGPIGPMTARPETSVEARKLAAKPVQAKPVEARPVANDTARSQASANSAVVRSSAMEAGAPPVDFDRIAEIRNAIERGHYPVIPMRVADAMIAAGLLLRSGK